MYKLIFILINSHPGLLDQLREASHVDFVHEKRHMDVLLETHPHPPPLRNVTHFFRLFILQVRLSIEYKNQDLLLSIHIYLKCKYTHKNAGFCILCTDDLKILLIFIKLPKFSPIFHRETSQANPSPPPSTST